jgi:nicotinate phosphoribosyltransferase
MVLKSPISPLLTDLYELTMAAAYWANGMDTSATFSLFSRKQPERSYFVAAGLESVLDFLETFAFAPDDIDYLRKSGLFHGAFVDFLETLRFTGDIWAIGEGTLFFPNEPVLEVTAPLIQAQLIEPLLINAIGLNSMLATKAARCIQAAQGRGLIDFSLRRTQGIDAAMAAARSTFLTGFQATSNVAAGKRYGIPVTGTMAHSFIQAFDREADAFAAYAATFPDRTVLLVDTYDTLQGTRTAIPLARKMLAAGHPMVGLRLDSGDMVELSRQVRDLLDEAGLEKVQIVASGGFDEFRISEMLSRGAAIDTFGVGTKVGVSADVPYTEMVYKLVRYRDRDVCKRSPGKETLAGEKQVFRKRNAKGEWEQDIIGCRQERPGDAQALLHPVMEKGWRTAPGPSLARIRETFRYGFSHLPEQFRQLVPPSRDYPVRISPRLRALQPKAMP